jgi:antirestriction protein
LSTDLFKTRFVDCWVVTGSTGEYSDRREWNIAVFLTEAKAQDLVAELSEKAREFGLADRSNEYDTEEVRLEQFNKHFGFTVCDSVDYTGVSFYMGKTIFGG